MKYIGWRFPPLSDGPRQGYTNNDIEVFKGCELIDNLAREICQNSLDAHTDDSNEPVKVVFELKNYNTNDYSVFDQYKQCIAGCKKYWGSEMDERLTRFIKGADDTLKRETVPILIAGDYNTKGLIGSHSRKKSSSWEALTSSDGVSVKNDGNSAGSYGIGKNAPFACSSLSMVFYNTLAENDESAFIGVSRLATILNSEGKPTQRVGKYQVNDNENEVWTPIFPEESDKFRDSFLRTEYGTDVIIVGFLQPKDWMISVAKAVLKNFFLAISENRLIVELKDGDHKHIINSELLPRWFADLKDDMEMVATSQLYTAFISPDCNKTISVLESDDVDIYLKADSTYKRTIANFRATGMLVGTYYRRIFQHYAAVVIVRGKELGELLKDTEPPRHNRWDYKQIEASNMDKRRKAKKCIKTIEDIVLETLKSQFEVVTEDTVDAAGVGEYLPDEIDELGGQAQGDDILKVKVKIGKTQKVKKKRGQIIARGTKGKGIELEGDVHNHEIIPDIPLEPKPFPKPIVPDPDNPEEIEGVVSGKGTKSIRIPNISAQRAFPINASQGLYKIVVKPAESYERLYFSCSAVGEDGRTDDLAVSTATVNGRHVNVTKGRIGPVSVQADTPAVFFVRFESKEKMMLKLKMTEEK